jgi:hypothetical protein
MRPVNTRTHIDPPSLPLLRRASTLIAMGTVGLALAVAAPASAQDSKQVTTTTTTTVTTTTDVAKKDRKQSSADNIQKFLDIVRSMTIGI